MQEQMQILFQQTAMFATLLVLGLFLQKIKLFTDSVIDGFAAVITRMALPLMILTSIPSGQSVGELFSMGPFLLCACAMILFMLLVNFGVAKLARLKNPEKNVYVAMATFPNSGFVGYPLWLVMFPSLAPLAIACYVIVDTALTLVIGSVLTTPVEKGKKFQFKKLITPTTICGALGLIMLFLGLAPDNMVWNTLEGVGGTCKYLGFIYVGADLGRKGIKKLAAEKSMLWAVPVKLILCPLCIFFVLRAIGILPLEYVSMLTIMAMTPSLVVLAMFAKANQWGEDAASVCLVVTTIASIVTMPVMMQIMSSFS